MDQQQTPADAIPEPAPVDCELCGCQIPADDVCTVDGCDACQSCADDAHVCECCEERVSEDHGDGNVTLCQHCRENRYVACEDCECLVSTDDSAYYCDRSLCESCGENYFRCDSCGWDYHVDDYAGDGECHSCHDERAGECCDQSPGPEIAATSVAELRSPRRFGVELEFSAVSDAEYVCDQSGWGGCEDGTSGVVQEHYSPIMAGDDGLSSIRAFCELAADNGYDVSGACGFHLHIDMTGESDATIQRVAALYQTFLPVWQSFVPATRRRNTFCKSNELTIDQLLSGSVDPRNASERYYAVNWQAYRRHRTVEIRLHCGTADSDKVCNWVKAHLRFTDWAAAQSDDTQIRALAALPAAELFAELANIWADDQLTAFYRERAERFGTTYPAAAECCTDAEPRQ